MSDSVKFPPLRQDTIYVGSAFNRVVHKTTTTCPAAQSIKPDNRWYINDIPQDGNYNKCPFCFPETAPEGSIVELQETLHEKEMINAMAKPPVPVKKKKAAPAKKKKSTAKKKPVAKKTTRGLNPLSGKTKKTASVKKKKTAVKKKPAVKKAKKSAPVKKTAKKATPAPKKKKAVMKKTASKKVSAKKKR